MREKVIALEFWPNGFNLLMMLSVEKSKQAGIPVFSRGVNLNLNSYNIVSVSLFIYILSLFE